jgi:hypothetical protein
VCIWGNLSVELGLGWEFYKGSPRCVIGVGVGFTKGNDEGRGVLLRRGQGRGVTCGALRTERAMGD